MFAAFLVMLLCAVEGVYRFEVVNSVSGPNVTAGALTCKSQSEIKDMLIVHVGGCAWVFLVGGVFCLVDSFSGRDLILPNRFVQP